uniref:Uncharacterized protein n=1 Tax=Homalodisca liturata TaxID=320908 RepID=A0A1B6K0X1_9HEMI
MLLCWLTCFLLSEPDIFFSLADPNLLRKCLHGKTQNQNESFNNLIWSRIPKNTFVGLSTLKIGVLDSVISYNEGVLSKVKVLQKLCGSCGPNSVVGLKSQDQVRVYHAEKQLQKIEKRASQAKINRMRRLVENEEGSDNPDYDPGAY